MSSLLRTVHILTIMSLVGSTLVFILSMLDLGFASLWANFVTSPLTIIYHIVILVLQAKDNRSRASASAQYDIYPTAKVGSVVIAYLLAFFWLVPILTLVFVGGLWAHFTVDIKLKAANKTTVSFQLIFTVGECLLVLAIAAVSTWMGVLLKRWAKHQSMQPTYVYMVMHKAKWFAFIQHNPQYRGCPRLPSHGIGSYRDASPEVS